MKKSYLLIGIILFAITMLMGCKTPITMEEYVEKNPDRFESMRELTSEEIEGTIFAEDNTLYIRSQYFFEITDYDEIEKVLEETTDSEAVENFIKTVAAAGVQDPVVVLEHLDQDGQMITSFTFNLKQ